MDVLRTIRYNIVSWFPADDAILPCSLALVHLSVGQGNYLLGRTDSEGHSNMQIFIITAKNMSGHRITQLLKLYEHILQRCVPEKKNKLCSSPPADIHVSSQKRTDKFCWFTQNLISAEMSPRVVYNLKIINIAQCQHCKGRQTVFHLF